MGLFGGFLDDVVGLDPNGGGIIGSTGLGQITDPLEDFLKDITGQAAQDELKDISKRQAEPMERFLDLLQPTIEAGQAQIEPLGRSATVSGFGENIGSILSGGALSPLVQERQRAADALMSSRGLRRSGAAVREAANIPTDLALSIENELNRRRQSISGAGQTGIAQSGNITGQIGQILAGGQQAGLQARAAGTQSLLNLGGSALLALSDPSLKNNISKVGELGDLSVIAWDWNDKALDMFGLSGSSVGFNAKEVRDKHPECTRIVDGILMVDYENVLKRVA